MWTNSYTASTAAAPRKVWDAIEALHSGVALGPDSDLFELHGPFGVGTTLTVTPHGQDAMESTITECEPERVYADRTVFGGLVLTFRHRLSRTPDGGTEVTHTVEIDGPEAEEVGPHLGPQISDDFPVAMAELLAAAERGVRVSA